jgi:hypothetical protein
MPPPAFVVCELCHKKFGKHSLAIHMKQCIEKREASTAFCPVCDNIVSNDEYEKHVSECKVVNAEAYKKKKAAEAASKQVVKAAPKAAGGPLSITGTLPGAKTGAPAPAPEPEAKRSKVPEHILKKMKEMSEPPEVRLLRRLGSPCDACGSAVANVACVGCHAVYCVPCSEGIHAVNKALGEHAPTVREVRSLMYEIRKDSIVCLMKGVCAGYCRGKCAGQSRKRTRRGRAGRMRDLPAQIRIR